MKNLFILLFAISLFACQDSNQVKIRGTISNSDFTNLVFSNLSETYKDSIPLLEDGTFNGSLNLNKEGMFYLNNDVGIYLTPGSDLNVELDVKAFDDGIDGYLKMSGKGNDAANLVFNVLDNNYNYLKGAKELFVITPDKFEISVEEFYNSNINLVDSVAENGELVTNGLVEKLKLLLAAKRAEHYYTYSRVHKHYAKEDTSEIPEYFSIAVDSVSLTNAEAFNDFRQYRFYVIGRNRDKVNKTIQNEKLDFNSAAFINRFINLIAELDADQVVKDEIGKNLYHMYPRLPDSLAKVVFERYPEIVKNKEYVAELNQRVKSMENLKEGNPAPEFSYPDINGKVVSSKDLLGKVVYIDVWATWCGPCVGEIPSLKKLEQELHGKDIAFVSISTDQDTKKWEQMVKEKELGGIQLHDADGWRGKIMTDYVISGIPRFILIDKEGKLVSASALRPSNPETKDMLLKLLADN
jgi:thiol-disulfide isomerase/thioredoxin